MIKLEVIAQIYNLKYSKQDNVAYGEVNGVNYTITPTENANIMHLETNTNVDASGRRADINTQLIAKAKTLKKCVHNFIVKPYSIGAQINTTNAQRVEMLSEVFAEIKNTIDEYSLKPCCGICGKDSPVSPYYAGTHAMNICDSCAADAISSLEQMEADNRAKKGNVIAGTVGALLGALIGGILWVLVYQLGYVAAIVGIVAVICSYKGYTMFAGKKDIKGVIISIIASLVALFLAHMICGSIVVFNEFQSYGITYFEALSATPEIMFAPEMIGSFFGDLIIGYVFLAIGAFSFVKSAIQNPTGKAKFSRIEETSVAEV